MKQVGGPFDGFEIISEYSDEQAVEDGVLVNIASVTGDHNDRATIHLWGEYTRQLLSGMLTDITELSALYKRVKEQPIKDEWRILPTPKGEVWLIPNEVGGLTLMFASDY